MVFITTDEVHSALFFKKKKPVIIFKSTLSHTWEASLELELSIKLSLKTPSTEVGCHMQTVQECKDNRAFIRSI